MATEPCASHREQIGALVLGDLDASSEARLRAHAEGCEGCRNEIAALEPVARLLTRADADRVSAPAIPPAGLAPRLARRLGDERRALRRRRIFTGVAAAAATALVAVSLALLLGGGEPEAQVVSFDTGDPDVGLTANLTSRAWGTEVEVSVRGIHEGTRCNVTLIGADGERTPAGSFRYRYGEGSDRAPLTSALTTSEVAAVEIEAGDETYRAPLE
jgi:hypothetical protein